LLSRAIEKSNLGTHRREEKAKIGVSFQFPVIRHVLSPSPPHLGLLMETFRTRGLSTMFVENDMYVPKFLQ